MGVEIQKRRHDFGTILIGRLSRPRKLRFQNMTYWLAIREHGGMCDARSREGYLRQASRWCSAADAL